jgi:glycosyltransferase involved in cell wall biosynthesis
VNGSPPAISVVVPTYNRPQFLPELVAALEAQTIGTDTFEVVLVDNGSGPEAASAVAALDGATGLRLTTIRLDVNEGPAGARNRGVAEAAGDFVAFTDDDCLPTPQWLAAVRDAFASGADVVQGRTVPAPGRQDAGPWARSIWVTEPTALFETCNIAYRRDRFLTAGGFDAADPLTRRPGGRAFGEDALLGARVVAGGGKVTFAPEAVVHHRWLPAKFGDWLRERRQLRGFPALAGESAVLREQLTAGVFLSPDTAIFDLALAGVLTAALTRKPVLAAAAVPWAIRRWPAARFRRGRPPAFRLAQLALTDLIGLASLLEGSVKHRRLIL